MLSASRTSRGVQPATNTASEAAAAMSAALCARFPPGPRGQGVTGGDCVGEPRLQRGEGRAKERFEGGNTVEVDQPLVGIVQQFAECARALSPVGAAAWRSASTVSECCATDSGAPGQIECPPQR